MMGATGLSTLRSEAIDLLQLFLAELEVVEGL
jgi:hypothetical protein